MARLIDTSGTIILNLSFHNRTKIITNYDDKINNWIPIDFELAVYSEKYNIYPEVDPKLNMFEIDLMFSKLRSLITEMQLTNKFSKVEISTFEFLYELEFYDLEEDGKIKCTVWTFEAIRTNGVIQNCQRGFRFNIALNSLIEFTDNLEQELNHLLK
ncbi:WapI family immunity protein [Paenibacillus sp. HW567]|uniref:WapI family immunity protein n=1 Tax=Paenibacillus sp. HW567 TaxID=1034769 RepID=UPI00037BED9B|nr:hypothetical protein [Paenibacillus sp. HW567]